MERGGSQYIVAWKGRSQWFTSELLLGRRFQWFLEERIKKYIIIIAHHVHIRYCPMNNSISSSLEAVIADILSCLSLDVTWLLSWGSRVQTHASVIPKTKSPHAYLLKFVHFLGISPCSFLFLVRNNLKPFHFCLILNSFTQNLTGIHVSPGGVLYRTWEVEGSMQTGSSLQ